MSCFSKGKTMFPKTINYEEIFYRCCMITKQQDILVNWKYITLWQNITGGLVSNHLSRIIWKVVEFVNNSRLIETLLIPHTCLSLGLKRLDHLRIVLVFESTVWSRSLASKALDRDRDRSSKLPNCQKTEPDLCRPVFSGFLRLQDRSWPVEIVTGLPQVQTGWD